MSAPTSLQTIANVAPLIASGAISPVDLVRGCLERIDARRDLNAFITVLADGAAEDARTAEREIASGRYRGALHGIPVSLKDLIDAAGTPTTSGSAVPPRRPAVDAPLVARLREAGAIIIGKTNLHEFAYGATNEDSSFGPTLNPHDPRRSPGGSSGGSAVSVATRRTRGRLIHHATAGATNHSSSIGVATVSAAVFDTARWVATMMASAGAIHIERHDARRSVRR